MLLRDLLSAGRINPAMKAKTRDDALAELVDVLVSDKAFPLPYRDELLKSVIERENMQTTGVENGVAIPHVPSVHISKITGALGIHDEPIGEWQSIDGSPIRFVLLLVAPKDSFRMHVKALWSAAKLFSSPQILAALRQSKTPEEIMRVIESAETQQEFYE
ncbi:MAG: PTS sugar transporter subunit IIA [Planctomycetota bacterium]|jgi:PTS system fructose-specific IIC component